jgi:hypothetical protein
VTAGGKALNALLFQAGWFAAVLGAAYGRPWAGTLAVGAVLGAQLARSDDRQGELKLMLAAGSLGFLFDSALVAAGIVVPKPQLFPRPFSPPWMIVLWPNFAATLNGSLAWLKARNLASAVFGAIGGPLAYYGGARLAATESFPTPAGLLILAVGWGIATPLLLRLAEHFRRSP